MLCECIFLSTLTRMINILIGVCLLVVVVVVVVVVVLVVAVEERKIFLKYDFV